MKCVRLSTAFAILLGAAGAAQAGVANGSFETGDFTDWTTSGAFGSPYSDVVTFEFPRSTGSPPNWTPTHGSYFASLWNTDGVSNFSSLEQQFSGTAGETLSFDYFLDYGDLVPGFPNSARFSATLSWNGGASSHLFFSTDGDTLGDQGDQDWSTASFGLSATDTYTLTFYVEAFGDPLGFESFMGIDDIQLRDGGPIIPLPTSAGLAVAGLGLLGLRRRR